MKLRVVLFCLLTATVSCAGTVDVERDPKTNWQVYTLNQANTTAKVIPEAGCNLFSFCVDDVEYLRVPDELSRVPGVGFGTPILYPTPNRVRGAQFSFQGRRFHFPPNSAGNFIHGLVHSVAWRVTDSSVNDEQATLNVELVFDAKMKGFDKFPLRHRIGLSITVASGSVRWVYSVDNSEGATPVPFGFALHPYFLYQGDRAKTFLTVPATHWMKSEKQLPSGELVPLGQTPFDLRKPISFGQLKLDDVFFGMQPDKPVVVEFRDMKRRLVLESDEAFTHLVVYTPNQPFFCVENQTCSTDAHNLASAGKKREAHLQICPPGQVRKGWVRFMVETN